MNKEIPYKFGIIFDNDLKPTSDPDLYTGSVRVFYKYRNRNGSYITDEFAEKFAKTAYMKPVMGYYNVVKQDFEGHESSELKKSYGFVLPDSLRWEEHTDLDGVTRSYATYDVILWAEMWQEAKKIFNKSQSMEIDPKTIVGDWKEIDDDEAFVYTEGVMAGLCVLGDDKTPCFEGSAFFSLEAESYKKFSLAIKNYYYNGGKTAMNVKVSGFESENFEMIWNTLNPNFTEEGAYSIDNLPFFEDETSVRAYRCVEGKCFIIEYTKEAQEDGTFTLAETATVDTDMELQKVNEEKQAIQEQFEAITEQHTELQNQFTALTDSKTELDEQLVTLNAQFVSLNEQFETLTTEKGTLEETVTRLQSELATLQGEYEVLNSEKKNLEEELNSKSTLLSETEVKVGEQQALIEVYENAEKDRIIEKFSKTLSSEVLSTYVEKKDELSIEQLNTQLAIEYTNFSLAKEQGEGLRFPQPKKEEESAFYKLVKNYKKD